MNRVVVRAPATTSNLGPGFDVFGLALDAMYDVVEAVRIDGGVRVEVSGVGSERIPTTPEHNTAGRVAIELAEQAGLGVELRVRKGIPPGSGLGSSAASAAATAVALNRLFNLKLDQHSLVEVASRGEVAAAGAPHADQVAAAIYGGFIIIQSYRPLRVAAFPPPSNVEFVLAVPRGIRKTTRQARAVLPRQVELERVVENLGAAGFVAAGMLLSNPELIGLGVMGDRIVEPVRIRLYPGCERVKRAAVAHGASGATLSGAGPTMLAIVNPERASASIVAEAMKRAYGEEGVECECYVAHPCGGAEVIAED